MSRTQSSPTLRHLDANGVELRVGDVVRFGDREGIVHILEDWSAIGSRPRTAGVYVSDIGTWGDFRAVEANRVVKVEAVEYVVQVLSGGRWSKVRGSEGGPYLLRSRAERIARARENATPSGLSSTEGQPHRVVEARRRS